MFEPDRLLALNNSIGLLVVAALNPEQPDFEALIGEFRLCLNNYDAWAEQFWTGTALDIEQVLPSATMCASVRRSPRASRSVRRWSCARPTGR
ncbi:hypothetical protein [Pseudomonas granadensis]|uniref:hypothetical protein n=1 Tax=Pseudomonas granadensis TaxID=1421430 RepID=UPI00087BEF00|nr:hypothetical protein [Pseudomonas granadensis]SDS72553.1 hypothetical protein SAMN05216579_1462 [Pseudomonas granadensis]